MISVASAHSHYKGAFPDHQGNLVLIKPNVIEHTIKINTGNDSTDYYQALTILVNAKLNPSLALGAVGMSILWLCFPGENVKNNL